MGAVYQAADLRLARSVAVKIMLGRAFGDRQALRRFEREAQASARLTHPNIVTVLANGADLVKVLDFGLAKMTALDAEDSGGLTHPGVVIGTAGYMAPDQLTAGEVDERSDVFALGVMAAEAVTGRRPFRGRSDSELLMAIMNEPFTLGVDGAEVRRLESVLQRAVARDASARYPSVAALARELLPALRDLPSIAPASGADHEPTVA